MLGSVVKLQAFEYPPGLSGLKGLVQRGGFMGVQVVQHHPNLLRRRVSFISQPPHLLSEVNHGAPFAHCHVPPARPGLAEQEQVSGSIALVFIVKTLPSSRLGPDGRPGLGHQLLGSLPKQISGKTTTGRSRS